MALQHLRSSTADKRPTPAAMAEGQLALNSAAVSPGLFFKNASGALVKVGPVHVGTTAPNATPASGGEAGNSVGEQWLDTSGTNPVLKIWDGSGWASEAGEFVNASGDTMTGALVMDNQQQVRFRETTANGTNYIAIQAPASVAADRTLTLPDVDGTLVSSGDTGTVTSTMIANGTIVDADISASAAIVDTKLATISTAGKVSNSATTATNANTASAIVARDGSGNFSAGTITAALTGNASTATTLQTGRTISLTGDVTYTSGTFDGSGNVTGTATLANSGVSSGTYKSVTVDAKGRVTAGTNPTTLAGYGITDAAPLASPALTGTPTAPTAAAGTNTTQIATTAFVTAATDAARQGLSVKQSCRVATTANITLSGTQAIDGVAIAAGNRVLVKNQTTASQNGLYVVAAGAWARATDFDADADVTDGAFVFIEEGTANADSGWVLTTDGAIVIGTTSLAFAQFSGAGQIDAGSGLTKTGNTINAVGTAGRIVANADSIDLAAAGDPGTYRSVTTDAYGRVTSGSNPTTFSGYGISDTSENLAAAITDETGSGSLVFATSPTLVTPVLGVATGTSFNSITGLSSSNPTALGAVAVGTGTTTARADHVHPTTGLGLTSGTLAQFAATTSSQLAGVISDETGSGALVFAASPTLSGTPLSTTAAADTSTTQIATTAFVLGQASAVNPLVNGTAAVGTSLRYSRQDHVHPTDTTRAATGQTMHVGTTALAINRASAAQTLTGVSIDGNAATVTTNANLTGDVTSVGNATSIAAGVIVNADINASAEIVDTKLATITTAGKVSNSATTATNANTASAIVARDGSGNFSAGTITAALTGAASANVLKAGDTMTGVLAVTAGTAALPAITPSGDPNTGIYSPGADQVAISTNGTGRLFIDSTGNIGVNVSSPTQARLVVASSAGANTAFFTDGTNSSIKFLHGGGGAIITTESGQYLGFGTSDTERMRITSAGLLGLGTSSPQAILSITPSASLSTTWDNWAGDAITFDAVNSTAGTGNYGPGISWKRNGPGVTRAAAISSVQTDADADVLGLAFFTHGSTDNTQPIVERLRITGAGNVGIGTTSPLFPLDVNGVIYTRGRGSTFGVLFDDWRIYNSTAPGALVFDNGSERARIDSSGRLLVGTSTARAYSVTPQIQLEGSAAADTALSISRISTNSAACRLILAKARGTVGTPTIVSSGDLIGSIAFEAYDGTSHIEAGTIRCEVDGTPGANDMPGRLVFSTTADGASSPTERMRIASGGSIILGGGSPSANTTLTVYPNDSNGAALADWNRADTANTSTAARFRNNATTVGSISYTNTATAYNTSSDYRLKDNVVPLTGAANRLNQLQVHRFNFIADPDKTFDGFIAHEAQAVVPECVTGTKDEVDEDGNPVYQGIDQSKLVPLLTAALQEAIGRIETLEAEVAALKGV